MHKRPHEVAETSRGIETMMHTSRRIGVWIALTTVSLVGCEESQMDRARSAATQAAKDAEPYVDRAARATTQAADRAAKATTRAVDRARPYVDRAARATTRAAGAAKAATTQAVETIRKKVSGP